MILIMLGSSQDLNMVAQGEETTIWIRIWTRSPRMNYSRISQEAIMVMKKPPVMIPPSGRVPEQGSRSPILDIQGDGGSISVFVENNHRPDVFRPEGKK